jgi:hypothetical protein
VGDRPLDRVYPVLFIDAIVVEVRDGQVVNRPIYVVIGVTVNGERDILVLWAGDGAFAKFWLAVLTEIKTGASVVEITVIAEVDLREHGRARSANRWVCKLPAQTQIGQIFQRQMKISQQE